jgi:hypothetical protein
VDTDVHQRSTVRLRVLPRRGALTLCMRSRLSGEQYVHVTSSSLKVHSAAVDAWQACAVMLPKGHFISVQRSLRSTTY